MTSSETDFPRARSSSYGRQADRIMLPLLWILFATALGLAPWHDTWHLALWIGLPLALIPTALIFWQPGQLVTRLAVATAFMLFCALHIHQSLGTIELHFGIFVLLAVLLCYRDMRVILLGAAVIAVHHLSFNFLQEAGFPTYCFVEPGLGRVIAHATYVVIETAALCYIARWMRRDARQTHELTSMVARVTEGGHIRLGLDGPAPASPMGVALHQVLQAIAGAVARVRENALAIDQSLERITASNEAVSAGAHDQAAAIGQAAASIQAIGASLADDQQRAQAAQQDVDQTVALAGEGSQTMTRSVESMREMRALSQRITEITTLIDGIAFQTNILALNASVEAARAGEHGRGFAVVAGEVRTLAQRSADASRQIRNLIDESVRQVAEGTDLIEHSGRIMTRLADGIGSLHGMLEHLRQANASQSGQIQDLERAIGKIQDIARDTLHQAQDAGALVGHLDQGARRLNQAVGLIS
ncbi:methyl-accepting chemotaxis protein [Castellaniella defragrans 65Phen]|uniref:Methyl-accepting chemotaxis protein n=2 Tax=Castellaniella defragrans TaxID=75697 RepID=W8X510_CASD6|nr:methyl-accepting chemotaxis protein [Castellaniella defragrans]KAB0610263.1 chemotaxis protein [Castellaniella defragrans]MBB6082364.1 methyl-accepting chemotaxis protein [Castellaniella defragrans]CDM24786.1 methyl-accepting chemotaxis protein [Castellaniella defragrans 65Phen]